MLVVPEQKQLFDFSFLNELPAHLHPMPQVVRAVNDCLITCLVRVSISFLFPNHRT